MSGAPRSDDFYLLLGVPSTASEDEIYAAYRDRCFLLHPDRLAGAPPGARQRAEQDIRRLNRAWEVLGDPVSRAAHDAWYTARDSVAAVQPASAVAELPERSRRAAMPWPAIVGVIAVIMFGVGAGSTALVRRARERGAPVASAAPVTAPTPTAIPDPAPPSIVADGGFETDAGGWVLEGGVRRAPGAGRAGSAGVRVPGDGNWDNAYRTIELPAPGCFQITAWVRGDGSARIDVLTIDWGPVATVRLGRGTGWSLQGGTVVTERTGPMLLAIRDSEAGAPLVVDDIAITPCMRE